MAIELWCGFLGKRAGLRGSSPLRPLPSWSLRCCSPSLTVVPEQFRSSPWTQTGNRSDSRLSASTDLAAVDTLPSIVLNSNGEMLYSRLCFRPSAAITLMGRTAARSGFRGHAVAPGRRTSAVTRLRTALPQKVPNFEKWRLLQLPWPQTQPHLRENEFLSNRARHKVRNKRDGGDEDRRSASDTEGKILPDVGLATPRERSRSFTRGPGLNARLK
jgi:hypothetical protein